MGLLDIFRRGPSPAAGSTAVPAVQASGQTANVLTLDDPRLAEFLSMGMETASGETVSVASAMRNPAVFRAVALTSSALAMLPMSVHRRDGERGVVADHPVHRVLSRRPNGWQSPYDFRQLMTLREVTEGNGYARIVRTGNRITALLPLDPKAVSIKQAADGTVTYRVGGKDGRQTVLPAEEVLHLRGLSLDGLSGLSLVKQAAEAIGLAQRAHEAAARLFKNGMMIGGALKHPGAISAGAAERLRQQMEARHMGAENAHKWLVFEEGMEPHPMAASARDSQHLETRSHQIAEICRVFGTPRPLLFMDDTSWGSGIDVLGQFFVRYGLAPRIAAWEQSAERSLLTEAERERLCIKVNAGALLRGSLRDQAEFFAKALGAGGHQPWMGEDEVRDLMDLGARDRGDLAPMASRGASPAPANDENEPAATAA